MMRFLCCLLLALTACSSRELQCDRHLQRINAPPVGAAAAAAATATAAARGTP